jgi:drug/metabolite transporter (DMT)-like permease
MTPLLLGLSIALLWGGADISASLATRHLSSVSTTVLAQGSAFVLLLALTWFTQSDDFFAFPSWEACLTTLGVGIVLGLLSTVTYLLMYRSLQCGPLSLVSPILSANGALTMIQALCFFQNPLTLASVIGLSVIGTGLGLATGLARRPAWQQMCTRWWQSGIPWAVLALIGLGELNFGLAAISQVSDWFSLLFWARWFALVFLVVWVLLTRLALHPCSTQPPAPRAWSWSILWTMSAGVSELLGVWLYSMSTRQASVALISLVASLSSLFPILVGICGFRERLSLTQGIGMLFIIGGLGTIAVPPNLAWLLAVSGATLILVSGYFVVFCLWVRHRNIHQQEKAKMIPGSQ